MQKIGIIGGGAAGYFLAANLPQKTGRSICILEKAARPLQKVKISGGGRCNVTHACFDPRELTGFYPRGHKELRSVFSQFQPGDTMDWFDRRGVELKIEEDNRIFPASDDSQTIINCFRREVTNNDVEELFQQGVKSIKVREDGRFEVQTSHDLFTFDKLIVASGSSKQMWKLLTELGHTIVEPLPSLFTFNIKHELLQDVPGLSFPSAEIKIRGTKLQSVGSLLITHWGVSGPGVLKLSAWGARELAAKNYHFTLAVNWIGMRQEDAMRLLMERKAETPKQKIAKHNPLNVPKRFWAKVLHFLQISPDIIYADISKKLLQKIAHILTNSEMEVKGKSTNKDEFVTCGGIQLKEVNFKTMESKLVPNLYFAGEVLNIDAVTGGFNFQAAWSTAFLISRELEQ